MSAIVLAREILGELPGMDWGVCPRCLDPIQTEDGHCIRLSLPGRDPIRFHDDCYAEFVVIQIAFHDEVVAARKARSTDAGQGGTSPWLN